MTENLRLRFRVCCGAVFMGSGTHMDWASEDWLLVAFFAVMAVAIASMIWAGWAIIRH